MVNFDTMSASTGLTFVNDIGHIIAGTFAVLLLDIIYPVIDVTAIVRDLIL